MTGVRANALDGVDGQRLRVAVLADMLEEGWTSMDLVASELVRCLQEEPALGIDPRLLRPRLLTLAMPWHRRIPSWQRVINRFWLYRRTLPAVRGLDVFHVVDHSYAHLVLHLPPGRTVVTCHDTDAFSPLVGGAHATGLPPFLVKRIVEGLRRAAVVVCPSRVTAAAVVDSGLVPSSRVVVVPNGVDLEATDLETRDTRAAPLLGPPGEFVDVLNVGSTIGRKRIDLLLKVFAEARRRYPRLRLVRVGGPFTASQERLARELGVRDHIVVLPLVDRTVLAAVYQRAALLLATSEREGFGLPVAEALAVGTPVIAADLPVVREVAADAATLVADPDERAWTSALCSLLDEHGTRPGSWLERVARARSRGAVFSWSRYARAMSAIYRETADGCLLAAGVRAHAPVSQSSGPRGAELQVCAPPAGLSSR